MSYHPITIANALLRLANAEGETVTMLRLLKLVYIAHGWSLGLRGEPLTNEPVEAWQFGPVYPSVYRHWKGAGPYAALQPKPRNVFRRSIASVAADDQAFLESVWKKYKRFTAPELVGLTHRDDTPWAYTYRKSPGAKGLKIDDDIIKHHYE